MFPFPSQIVQFSQTTTLTLPLPLGHGRVMGQTKLSCFDPTVAGVSRFDSASTLLPTLALAAPPQFADSPPDEVKRKRNVINCKWVKVSWFLLSLEKGHGDQARG